MWPLNALIRAALLVSLAAAGCAPVRVHSYVPTGTNLSRYSTYAWASPGAFDTGDPRLDNNTLFVEHLQASVDRQLQRKGFRKVGAEAADVTIHYHARVAQRLEFSETPVTDTPCRESACGPFVYDAGTLLLDFVDTRSQKLAWRGWAERSLDGVIDNQSWMEKTVDQAVVRILDRLPY